MFGHCSYAEDSSITLTLGFMEDTVYYPSTTKEKVHMKIYYVSSETNPSNIIS